MKRLTGILICLGIFAGIVSFASVSVHAQALNPCDIDAASSLCSDQNSKGDYKKVVKSVTDLILYIVGAAAVVMIIISAIRYTTSTGDQGRVASAKKTLIGAVVGLMVAIFAYAIVTWVFNMTSAPATPPTSGPSTPAPSPVTPQPTP
jgi:hypothetical protein